MKMLRYIAIILLAAGIFASCSRCTDTGKSTDGESVVPVPAEDSEKELVPDTVSALPAGEKQRPTVIEFSATWCGPCRRQKPIYEKAIEKYSDRIAMQSVDVDENPQMADKYNIDAVPTFIFIDGYGRIVGRANYLDEASLEAALNNLLAL